MGGSKIQDDPAAFNRILNGCIPIRSSWYQASGVKPYGNVILKQIPADYVGVFTVFTGEGDKYLFEFLDGTTQLTTLTRILIQDPKYCRQKKSKITTG